MKLFTRYNRINLLATLFIFGMAIVVFYFFLRYVLVSQVDEDLEIERTEIVTYTNRFRKLPEVEQQKDQQIFFTPISRPFAANYFKTITGKSGQEDLRELLFSIHLPGGWYRVTVTKSLEGTDHLTRSVATITLGTILLILTVSFTVNRLVLSRLWRPFYATLAALQEFRLGKNEQLELSESTIDEFTLMNNTLHQATQKAGQDYILLKEFTENASHELQTPLAVIQSKLELLMQHNLNAAQSEAVQSAGEAIQKLARLNQSLLLLAKIQNQQFSHIQTIDLKKVVENKLVALQELWESRQITLQANLSSKSLEMSPDLAAILIGNLLSNAIRHNHLNGTIAIVLTANLLQVTSTGSAQPLDKHRLFTRFYNPTGSESSTGLGLSIIRQIADVYRFRSVYEFENGRHCFTILF